MKVINNDYEIFASDIELLQELSKSDDVINWKLFENDDNFYNENGERYQVLEISHSDKYVILFQ